MSTSGSGTRSSTSTQSVRKSAAAPEQRKRTTGRPAPGRPFCQCEQQRDQPSRERHRAWNVDSRGRLDRRLGHEARDEKNGNPHRDRPDHEQPPPGKVVDDQSCEDDPEPAADAEHGRDEPDRDADSLPGEFVPDDREAQRKHSAADTLNGAERDQRPDVPRGGRADAADEEDRQREDEHALLAVLVAELPEDRRRHRRDE
jgi:hypothetical protein